MELIRYEKPNLIELSDAEWSIGVDECCYGGTSHDFHNCGVGGTCGSGNTS